MDLFNSQETAQYIPIPIKDGEALLVENFLSSREAENLFQYLRKNVTWSRQIIKIYGKVHPVPRESAWFGDPLSEYYISGVIGNISPWLPELLDLKNRVEKAYPDLQFNSVLLNKYRNGTDKVGWHSDNDKEFGVNPSIASLSLGATRRFDIRHKTDRTKSFHINLNAGSLLIMKGAMQHNWEHQVPQQKHVTGERINLTFRKILGM
jgi:alkylated DNA repair dioxygenase AlkB